MDSGLLYVMCDKRKSGGTALKCHQMILVYFILSMGCWRKWKDRICAQHFHLFCRSYFNVPYISIDLFFFFDDFDAADGFDTVNGR